MSLHRCKTCSGDMDVFLDAPACLHQPPCAISFCWPCGSIWYRGACAKEALDDSPPRIYFANDPAPARAA